MSSRQNPDLPVTADALLAMGRHPGPFVLVLDGMANETARVSCIEVVRAIPGKRLVCRGEWQGQVVYTKVYMGSDKYWQAERQGLQALNEHDIAAPVVLHTGTADNGQLHIIILAAIEPAQTLLQVWEQATDEASRIQLLKLAVSTIAQHHQAGLEQRDIHLNNFLLSDGRLYTLDGGGVHSPGEHALSFSCSRDNLARFFAQLYPHFDDLVEKVLPGYVSQRAWPAGQLSVPELLQQVRHFRRGRQRHFLKKIYRECSAFVCKKTWRSFQVYDRALESPALLELLADPDASLQMPGARYLKQGNTCTLWVIAVGGRLLVVKRYNIKGLLHRIKRAVRRTRASISWKNAHRLAMYGILGARPVALYERRFGLLRGKAWLIMEYLEGDDLSQFCEQLRAEDDTVVVRNTTAVLAQLARCCISHGDMKGTNFIRSPRGIAVIDLDAMREHESVSGFRRSQRRDLRRFMRNWERCPELEAQFRESMQHNNLVTEA